MHANHQSGGASHAHPAAFPPKRTQTPAEALGIAAGGNLLSSCLIATGLTAVALAALTAGPYFAGKVGGGNTAQAAPAKPDETPAPVEQPKPDPSAKKPPTADTPKPKTDVLDKLGETGTKTGNPKVNPLDKGDDLFKDLK